MNTAKHTPGPWQVNQSDVCIIEVSKQLGIGCELPIADVQYNPSREHPGEHVANAHLIAAAPAMYEALKQAQELIRSLVAEEMIHPTELQRVGNCQATMWQTLAQAEGS